jgi:hypothetical protein
MKYIKLFERRYKVGTCVFWVIYGNIDEIHVVLNKMNISFPGFRKMYRDEKDVIGICLGYDPTADALNSFDYYPFDDDEDYIAAKQTYKGYGFEFQGEIKIVDDKIIIDPTEADAEKYNL